MNGEEAEVEVEVEEEEDFNVFTGTDGISERGEGRKLGYMFAEDEEGAAEVSVVLVEA